MAVFQTQETVEAVFHPTFGSRFFDDHARRMIQDPGIAITELCANAYDAGADTVRITWPLEAVPEILAIEDNGCGMTREEFFHRWGEINYNRRLEQSAMVSFPFGNRRSHRRAFGRNGKGRHSMFCFAEEYFVETWREGFSHTYRVTRPAIASNSAFLIEPLSSCAREGHGTRLWTTLGRHYLPISKIRDLIGSKFISDPSFSVFLNEEPIELSSLEHLLNSQEIEVEGIGAVRVSQIDTTRTSRTSHPHGIAWWVNNRLVGEVTWSDFKDTYDLDRRTIEAKRYTFVVAADILAEEVLDDWSGFRDCDTFLRVRAAVEINIRTRILEALKETHQRRKQAVLDNYASDYSSLTTISRFSIEKTIDHIQTEVPGIQEKVLDAIVEILIQMEEARTGSKLLLQLARLEPKDFDQLSEILDTWSVQDARIVLSELERRLKVIESLEKLVEDPNANELHAIHPLIASSLWIFGPEYESIHFTSNRTLVTVIRELLKDRIPEDLRGHLRPDILALVDSSISIYANSSFDERAEVNGFDKVLILELKKGGSRITIADRRQGEDYAMELSKTGKVQHSTKIDVFVLGSEVSSGLDILRSGATRVFARSYEVVLRQAHARTFNLLENTRKTRNELSLQSYG